MPQKKYFLSLGIIVKDEEKFLAEYLEWCILQGIDHCYVTENCAEDAPFSKTQEILESYLSDGYVTYDRMAGERLQLPAYQKMLNQYSYLSEWMTFLDCDEFLLGYECKVKDWLQQLPADCGSYVVHWDMYGSNGHRFASAEPVIARFTKRERNKDRHVKSIVRPDVARTGKNPHCFYLRDGFHAYRGWDLKTPLPQEHAILEPGCEGPLRIMHFHTKSYEEYKRRKLNPDPGSGVYHSPERVEIMFHAHDHNDVIDMSAAVYANRIKENLKKRGLLGA